MENETPEPMVLIQLGDRIRFESDSIYWSWEGKQIRIPPGTLGTVVAWNGTQACAMRIDGMKHPAFLDFPMERTFPGSSLIPFNMALVARKKVEEEEPLEPMPSWTAPTRKSRRHHAH